VGDDETWIREILKWAVVAQRKLDVVVLKEAMEWSLQDELTDFRGFLEVEGGSLVPIVPVDDQTELVQLNTQVVSREHQKLSPQFYVDEVEANYDIV